MKEVQIKLKEDTIVAMKAKDKDRLGVLRMLSAAIKQIIVDTRVETLSNEEALAVVKKMIKQRQDSIQQYTLAKREDLVAKEAAEIVVLEEFLPAQLSKADIEAKVDEVLATFAEKPTMKQMGMVMGKLSDLKAVADMGVISSVVKERLM